MHRTLGGGGGGGGGLCGHITCSLPLSKQGGEPTTLSIVHSAILGQKRSGKKPFIQKKLIGTENTREHVFSCTKT